METDSSEEESSPSTSIWSQLGFQSPQQTPRPPRPTPTPVSAAGASSVTFGSSSTTMATSTTTSNLTPTPSQPRIGGIKKMGTENVMFSGGGCLPSNRITEPLSSLAYRLDSDIRSIVRVEEACTRPFDEANKRIDEGVSTVTVTQWTNDVKRH